MIYSNEHSAFTPNEAGRAHPSTPRLVLANNNSPHSQGLARSSDLTVIAFEITSKQIHLCVPAGRTVLIKSYQIVWRTNKRIWIKQSPCPARPRDGIETGSIIIKLYVSNQIKLKFRLVIGYNIFAGRDEHVSNETVRLFEKRPGLAEMPVVRPRTWIFEIFLFVSVLCSSCKQEVRLLFECVIVVDRYSLITSFEWQFWKWYFFHSSTRSNKHSTCNAQSYRLNI